MSFRPIAVLAADVALLGLAACEDDPVAPPAGLLQDFSLLDVNPNSFSHDKTVSPRQYVVQISAWYFGHATGSYCSSQFGYLDQMQRDIEAAQPATPVQILGVNAAGEEAGNDVICAGRLLPWLQDTLEQNVWGVWHVTWRDVVILDRENRVLQVYNLTDHNLGNRAHYDALLGILLNAAR